MKNSFLICIVFCLAAISAHAGDKELRILTYNIKTLPREILSQHHHPIIRARIIPDYIIQENADIVVFEEAFDTKADRILRKRLKAQYPYILGPVNKTWI